MSRFNFRPGLTLLCIRTISMYMHWKFRFCFVISSMLPSLIYWRGSIFWPFHLNSIHPLWMRKEKVIHVGSMDVRSISSLRNSVWYPYILCTTGRLNQGLQASSLQFTSPLEFNAIFRDGFPLRVDLNGWSKIRDPVTAKFKHARLL